MHGPRRKDCRGREGGLPLVKDERRRVLDQVSMGCKRKATITLTVTQPRKAQVHEHPRKRRPMTDTRAFW